MPVLRHTPLIIALSFLTFEAHREYQKILATESDSPIWTGVQKDAICIAPNGRHASRDKSSCKTCMTRTCPAGS